MTEEETIQCRELEALILTLYEETVTVRYGNANMTHGDWFYIDFSAIPYRLGVTFESAKSYVEENLKYFYSQ